MKQNASVIIFALTFFLVNSASVGKIPKKCQKACHQLIDNKINVHLVPHSHDDVGWLKTYDQYYKGTGNFHSIENAGVCYIIDSVIKELAKNPERRFIQVETAFLYKWWQDQSEETRNLVRSLVEEGRLEIANGGWSMNDEAAAHYQSIIDQFTFGFGVLESTVGECGRPRIGWQIDPFGHSKEHAFIAKSLGFEGLVVGRIDYRDKKKRIQEKNLDFLWDTSERVGNATILTTMFPDFYVYPNGFCFDTYCGSNRVTDGNVESKVRQLASILDEYKEYYRTKNILIPMGHDFSYQEAGQNFESLDRLIKGFKNHATYNVIYSTPSCYIEAVKTEIDKNQTPLSIKTDDFFPYASESHSFWTGYFTSRPTSKGFERLSNNILQSAKQLSVIAKQNDDKIFELKMAMGVMQHHDAITGTEKQAVAEDYHKMLSDAIQETEEAVGDIVLKVLKKDIKSNINLDFSYCLLSNISVCDISSTKEKFVVAVHNPLSKTVSHHIRLPVNDKNYKVSGPDGEVPIDILDTIHSFDYIDNLKPTSKSLVFLAKNLPPLGIKLYYFEKITGTEAYRPYETITGDFFGNDNIKFTIDSDGKLSTIKLFDQSLKIKQDFYYYNGLQDYNSGSHRASGAYVFRPNGEAHLISKKAVVKCVRGKLLDEVHQIFSDEVTQIIRVYKDDQPYVEFDWLVGDLSIDSEGKNVITRFEIDDFHNKDIFYTDSNGRQMMERRRNHRNDYEYNPEEEPITSNYYPVTSRIVIKDDVKNLELALLNDRAQGGSSLAEGQIELMVHRREKRDDGFGVSEVLSEVQYGRGLYARGQHFLTFGKLDGSVILSHEKLLQPIVLLGDACDQTLTDIQQALNFKFEVLQNDLPKEVKLLTLEPYGDRVLLRLEHIFESVVSKAVSVDLRDLFKDFYFSEVTEVKLGGNSGIDMESNTKSNFVVELKPMEIRTFIIGGATDHQIPKHQVHSQNKEKRRHSCNSGTKFTSSMFYTCILTLFLFYFK